MTLIISCHADTGFGHHALQDAGDGVLHGMLDNFAGVFCVMQAYFSGRLRYDDVRVELTYGEEVDFAGAYEVLDTLGGDETVVVVDVTGIEDGKDFTIEKCRDEGLRAFLDRALAGMAYEVYHDTPDPIASEDETDVYSQKCARSCFLGVPVYGGDYNAGPVYCRRATLEIVAEALCRIVEQYARER